MPDEEETNKQQVASGNYYNNPVMGFCCLLPGVCLDNMLFNNLNHEDVITG